MKERALDKYKFYAQGEEDIEPIENLQFFLSLGLDGQDWLDVEPFLTAVRKQIEEYKQDAERYRFIRDNPWNGTDLEGVITCHLNAVWDLAIDRARGDSK